MERYSFFSTRLVLFDGFYRTFPTGTRTSFDSHTHAHTQMNEQKMPIAQHAQTHIKWQALVGLFLAFIVKLVIKQINEQSVSHQLRAMRMQMTSSSTIDVFPIRMNESGQKSMPKIWKWRNKISDEIKNIENIDDDDRHARLFDWPFSVWTMCA